jgi:hyperosmotically inducible protein
MDRTTIREQSGASWRVALAVAALLALPLGGCARETEIEGQGQDIEVEQGPGGTEVEVEPETQAEQDLEQAGQDLREAGRELEQNTRGARQELKENAEQAGEAVREGLEEAGQAIGEGARQVEQEVGPVAREVLSDTAVSSKVKAKLLADPEVAGLHIDVDTVDGQVTLNGKVASAAQKAEAEKLARGTEGVKSVTNLIQVAGQN